MGMLSLLGGGSFFHLESCDSIRVWPSAEASGSWWKGITGLVRILGLWALRRKQLQEGVFVVNWAPNHSLQQLLRDASQAHRFQLQAPAGCSCLCCHL